MIAKYRAVYRALAKRALINLKVVNAGMAGGEHFTDLQAELLQIIDPDSDY